ncbi:MAG TPA: DUF3617 family protein [Caulobacteraceae bacterium]|jgi:hypothetical protein
MRHRATALILAASAAAVAGCDRPKPSPALSQTPAPIAGPSRRAGLWEQKMFSDGRRAHGVVRVCLGAASQESPWLFAQDIGAGRCHRSMARAPDGAYRFASVCKFGQSAVFTSTGVARGDFSTSYDVQSVVTVTGAPLAEFDGKHDLRVEGRYRGACPPGMAPGEASLGRGINLNPRRLPQLANLFAGA